MPGKPFLCRSHPDFHVPDEVEVGKGFDGDEYGRRLKESHVDAVAFFAKCHYGNSYYPTKVGHPHPRLQTDMLGEVVAGCHRHEVGVVAYYSTFLDRWAAVEHPDWAVHLADGSTLVGRYGAVCVNTPYVDELLLPQAREIVSGYDVDEIFFDTMTRYQPCYCRHCRELFGHDIPLSPDDDLWVPFSQWYWDRFADFFARTAEAVHDANPEVAVAFNWMWGIRLPCMPPRHIQRLAADDRGSGLWASLHCRYWAGTGYPFDYMTGRFLHGLGDWNSAPPDMLKYVAAASVAHGGNFYIIDRMRPDGTLDEPAYKSLKETFGFVRERADYVTGTRHVPEIGVLHGLSTIVGKDLALFPDHKARLSRMGAVEGATRLLMEHGRHFTVLNEEALNRNMSNYRLLILPEQQFLADETKRNLAAYVENGGRLLISQATADDEVDQDMLRLAGVRFDGFTSLDYGYLGADTPIIVRGRFARTTPAGGGATELSPCVLPLLVGKDEKPFGHGVAPATGEADYPAAVHRKVGKGEVIYIAAPVFKSYCDYQSYLVAGFVFDLMDRLLPDPLVRVSAQAQVEAVTVRKGNDLIIHLLNHSGKERMVNYHWPVIDCIPELHDVVVEIRIGGPGAVIRSVPSREKLECDVADGYARCVVPRLHIMESLEVAGYFGGRNA